MVAALHDRPVPEGVFATGTVDQNGKVLPVGGLAEKVRAVLEQAHRFIVPVGQGLPLAGIKVVEVSTVEEAVRACFG